MFRGFIFGFLAVLITQVNADANRKKRIECFQNLVRNHRNVLEKYKGIKSCEGLHELVEDFYDFFEDCAGSGYIMEPMDDFVDAFCEPGSKMMSDLVSGKACWPSYYPLESMRCALKFIVNITDISELEKIVVPDDYCPSFDPLVECFRDSADKLCEGKSTKFLHFFVDKIEDMFDGMCDMIYGTKYK